MPTMDIFKGNAFNTLSLTTAVNDMEHVPGLLGETGVFTERGVRTTVVGIEHANGKLALVPTTPRGAPAPENKRDLRSVRNFTVPHIPFEDRIQADEIQGIRAFGTENELQAVQEIVNDRMAQMTAKMDATLEHHRIGAVKGVVVDADGSTLFDLFAEFGISAPTEIDFDLDNGSPASGAVVKKCHQVIRGIEDALGNAPYTGIVGLCSDEFFDDLVGHTEVRAAYERWAQNGGQQGDFLRQGWARRAFPYGNILWINYRGKVGNTSYIPANKARFYPVGVMDLFFTYFAPANFMETVNTIGLPRYAKLAVEERFQRWVDVHLQMNPLVMCTRPGVLFSARRT